MPPSKSDYLTFHVVTHRTLTIVTELRKKGYEYKHIQINHNPTSIRIYANNTELGNQEHTLYFPTSCDASHFRLPSFCQELITQNES